MSEIHVIKKDDLIRVRTEISSFPDDKGIVLAVDEDDAGTLRYKVLLKNEMWWVHQDEIEAIA